MLKKEVRYVKAKDICEIYNVTPRTVNNWRKEGLPCRRISQRLIRYDMEEVEKWIKERNENN